MRSYPAQRWTPFELRAAKETTSPLDVKGVDLGLTTDEIVNVVRESRSVYRAGKK